MGHGETIGLVYEGKFIVGLAALGWDAHYDVTLDRRNWVDVMLRGKDGGRLIHPFGLQVTLGANSLGKMQKFMRRIQDRRVRNLRYVYVQVDHDGAPVIPAAIAPDAVAKLVSDNLLAEPDQPRGQPYGIEIDPAGNKRVFTLNGRIAELSKRY